MSVAGAPGLERPNRQACSVDHVLFISSEQIYSPRVSVTVREQCSRFPSSPSDKDIHRSGAPVGLPEEQVGMEPSDSKRFACRSLSTFFESTHFQATVERIFVRLDIDNDQFQLAHQSQLVPALRDVIAAAAKWRHVQFVVLPVPYAHSLLPIFESFMQGFNKISVDLPNVLWLNDYERVDSARFAHSLGSNAFVTNWTAVDQKGHLSRKSIRAALRFLKELKPSIVPEDVDLTDPAKPEHASPSGHSSHQQSTSSSSFLRNVYQGKVQKHHREDYAARGAPHKRGGGGVRRQRNNNRHGQENRRN